MRTHGLGAILVVTLLITQGCGIMFQGSNQTIDIQSSPSTARVKGTPGIGEYTTPTSLSLSRKNSYDLTFTKEGYKPAIAHISASPKFGYILLDVLFTGLVGVVVDAATGGWNGLNPKYVSVMMEKESSSAIGPENIKVELCEIGSELLLYSENSPINVNISISKY